MRVLTAVLCLALAAAGADAASKKPPSWDAVQAERNLEKKARYALEYARARIDPMMEAYFGDDPEKGRQILARIQEAVELAIESLAATGKLPHKKPKHFKRAEIETRALLGDLREAQRDLAFDERADLDPTMRRIEEINEELLMGIMTKKKK